MARRPSPAPSTPTAFSADFDAWGEVRRVAFLWAAPVAVAGCLTGFVLQLPDISLFNTVTLLGLAASVAAAALLLGMRRLKVESALTFVYAVSTAYFLLMLWSEYRLNVGRDGRQTEAVYYLPAVYALAFMTWTRRRATVVSGVTFALVGALTLSFVPIYQARGQLSMQLISYLAHFLLSQAVLIACLASVTFLQERFARLRTLVYSDALTGLPNRRFVEEHAEVQRRQASVMSVAMFDIDHFKRVNDRFGHLTGDLVLREIARVSAPFARGAVVVARWGGEEFVVLLPHHDEREAARLLNQLRQAVASESFEDVQRVTVSAGVAQCGPLETFQGALMRADLALYEAKQLGRNVVVRASDLGARTPNDPLNGSTPTGVL